MRKRKRTSGVVGPIEEDILQHLTAGDMLVSFLLSGRSTRALYREAYKRARARYQYKRSIAGLAKKGFIKEHGDTLRLTRNGIELLEILAARKTSKNDTWKRRWWLVMYDIPISINPYRFELRRILIRSGFRKLQHSVWIHFRPCEELEIFLRNNLTMNKYVRYVESLPFPHMEKIADWKKLPSL